MKKINLDTLSETELRELNREIINRLKFYSETRQRVQLMSFRIGDRVEFDTDQGFIDGVIIRINQKTATIDADDGRSWRVSPHFLRKVAGASERPVVQTNLFQFPTHSK